MSKPLLTEIFKPKVDLGLERFQCAQNVTDDPSHIFIGPCPICAYVCIIRDVVSSDTHLGACHCGHKFSYVWVLQNFRRLSDVPPNEFY